MNTNHTLLTVLETLFQTVNFLGGTPLHYACRTGSLECVTALMSHCKFSINMSDSKGLTPIHRAAQNDQIAVVRSLLRRKPDLLEIPALEGLVEEIKIFFIMLNRLKKILAGLIIIRDGATPLLYAASGGALTTFKFLIKLGADLNKRDVHGDSLISRAAINFNAELLKFILSLDDLDSDKVWETLVGKLAFMKMYYHEIFVLSFKKQFKLFTADTLMLFFNCNNWHVLKL